MSGWGSGGSDSSWGSGGSPGGSNDWGQSGSASGGWGTSPSSGTTSASGWGNSGASPVPTTQDGAGGWSGGGEQRSPGGGVVTAPLLWLGLGLAVAVLAAALWFVSDGVPIAVVGWVLAGPIAIGFWALFLIKDSQRRAGSWYAPSAATGPLTLALVVTALAVVALHAYHVADTLSRSSS